MYTEIDGSQFSLVGPLLGAPTYLSLYSIINCKSSGRVWVDNTSSTSSALVWDLVNGFLFVLGKPSTQGDFREINHLLKAEVVPTARKLGYKRLNAILLFGLTKAQENRLFEGLSASSDELCHFQLKATDELNAKGAVAPQGVKLKMIDKDFLDDAELANVKEIRRCVMACWQDLSRYLSDGVGFAILNDNAAASWCSTDYVVSGRCDLYVETFEAYRRKGFGSIVASACVKECLNRRLEVNWHCWCQNLQSTGLAQKIGFLQKPGLKVQAISL
jgi:GNAT superfamily N-acetyltransferase